MHGRGPGGRVGILSGGRNRSKADEAVPGNKLSYLSV